MSNIIFLKPITNEKGMLSVIENILPFKIKRVFYIYNISSNVERGGHRHKKTHMALVCVHGNCKVLVKNTSHTQIYMLDTPNKVLYLAPQDWHIMKDFSQDAVLLVLVSEYYDKDDYIIEAP